MTPSGIVRCSTHPEVFLPNPFAGLLEAMMAGKFEWQFKYRDEADVNGSACHAHRKLEKSVICRHFCDSSDLVYRGIFGHR
ncbi:hypothetical protein FXB40_19795 [Bradyrhizobium rifense]|uniref:Uncharacterized protein n=1 Tax=Bradyrhizobium rifense TaxID=515499 RepID=A0A5D3KC08_9BRAD|nr:hypothetical protein FXB40_19795 [Bradyrhizobium rifense]